MRKRTSIARGNWLTISTRCVDASMKGQTVATATGSNRGSKEKRDSKVSRDNRARRASKANKDLKVDNRAVNSRVASNPVARRMAAVSQTVTGSVWGPIGMR